MTDTRVKPKLTDDVLALLGSTGDTNHPASLDPRDLPDNRTHRTGCRRYDHGVVRLRLADVEQPHIGGVTRHAEDPNRSRNRGVRRVELSDVASVRDGILLPPIPTQHEVADRKAIEVGLDDRRHGSTDHDVADLEPGGVGKTRAHSSTHIWVERKVDRPAEHLTLAGSRYLAVDETEVGILRKSVRARRELNLTVHISTHLSRDFRFACP